MNAELELRLHRMRELKDSIKVLEAEYKMINQQVIDGYFQQYEIYTTDRGLVLATYKCEISNTFNSAKFKTIHPDMYENFKEEKIIRRFLLK